MYGSLWSLRTYCTWVRYCVRLFLLHVYTEMLIINEIMVFLFYFCLLGILVWFPRCLQINVGGCLLTYCTYFTCAHREIKKCSLFIKQLKPRQKCFTWCFLLFDFKTAGQLGCVSVRLRGLRVLSSDCDTFHWLLMRLYWPVFNKVSKTSMARFMFIIYWKGA